MLLSITRSYIARSLILAFWVAKSADGGEVEVCYYADEKQDDQEGKIECGSNHVIRLLEYSMYNVACSSMSDSEETFINDGYILEMHRRCSARRSCDLLDIKLTETSTFTVRIKYECFDLRDRSFDPCKLDEPLEIHTSGKKTHVVLLGENMEKSSICQCYLAPQGNTKITSVRVQDVRLASEDGSCNNSDTKMTLTGAKREYDCKDIPSFQTDDILEVSSLTGTAELSLDTGKADIELMWINFRLVQDKRIVVNCSSKMYKHITSTATTATGTHTTTIHVSTEISTSDSATDGLTDSHMGKEGKGSAKSTESTIIAVVVSLVIAAIIVAGILLYWRKRHNAKKENKEHSIGANNYDYISENDSNIRKISSDKPVNRLRGDNPTRSIDNAGYGVSEIKFNGYLDPVQSSETYTEIDMHSLPHATKQEQPYSHLNGGKNDWTYSYDHISHTDAYSHIPHNQSKPSPTSRERFAEDTYNHLNPSNSPAVKKEQEDGDGYSCTRYPDNTTRFLAPGQENEYNHLGNVAPCSQDASIMSPADETYQYAKDVEEEEAHGENPVEGTANPESDHTYFVLEQQ